MGCAGVFAMHLSTGIFIGFEPNNSDTFLTIFIHEKISLVEYNVVHVRIASNSLTVDDIGSAKPNLCAVFNAIVKSLWCNFNLKPNG